MNGMRAPVRLALGRLRRTAERGSAVVEFVFLAVLMLVPLFYLVMMLARLQAGAYAVSVAAREAGRAYVTASTQAAAAARAQVAWSSAFEDQGFGGLGRVALACEMSVPLPLIPSFARGVVPLEVPVRARHVAVVDRFRGQP